MNQHIFKSKVWLTYKNLSMEKSFHKFRSKTTKCWVNTLSIIGFVASFLNLMVQLFLVKISNTALDEFPFKIIIYLSYALIIINTILVILIFSLPRAKIKIILYYFQYFTFGIALFAMNFSSAFYDIDQSKRFNYYGVEAFVRILNILGFFEFIDCFILTWIDILFYIPLCLIFTRGNGNGFFYAYLISKLSFMVVSYIIVYLRKINYYFCEENKQGKEWFRDVIENMKSGFIQVKDNKICLINDFMKEMIARNDKIMNIVFESQAGCKHDMFKDQTISDLFFDVEENSKKVLTELMKDFNNDTDCDLINHTESNNNLCSLSDCNKFENNCPESNKIPFFEFLKKQESFNGRKFRLVGTKSFLIKNKSKEKFLTLEVFCRYNRNLKTKKDDFEIIFNDITIAKQKQEKKSEIKYKSMFLSKIAHEFKNPLISILELINQLKENFRQMNEDDKDIIVKSEDTLNQIHSFSNYLMILIKDFDYFSQMEILEKKIPLDIEDCQLKEIFKFCHDIALSLLKRNGKEKNIRFEIATAEDVPDNIRTDEVKLKQILINIITNAIKFTSQGKVLVRVQREESHLEFRVSDTGVGIDSESLNHLLAGNDLLTGSNLVNQNGSNLGMSIIRNLTSALGKKIEITSEKNRGSEFFFSIPIEVNKINSVSSFCESNENPMTHRSSSTLITKKRKMSNNSSLMSPVNLKKENNLRPREQIQKTKIQKEKSLFFKNTKSEFEDKRKISPADFYHTQNINEDFDIIENNSSVNNSIVDVSERNSSSKRSTNKRNFLFFNPKFIIPCLSNKTYMENVDYDLSRFSIKKNIKSELSSQETKNNDSISGLSIDYVPEIEMNNQQQSKEAKVKRLSNQSISSSQFQMDNQSLSINNKVQNKIILLFDFIDQFKYFDLLNFKEEPGHFNILLVDDEKLTRSANRRLITVYAKNNNIKVNLIEAEDGFECMYILYLCLKKGVKISCVISDQTMTYLDGTITAKVLKELARNETLLRIPFYILTAYEDENTLKKFKQAPITNIFSKPIKKVFIEQIFKEINSQNT